MKATWLNGIGFEVVNRNTKEGERIYEIALTKCGTYYYFEDIFEAYAKPSITKVNIWTSWVRWFNEWTLFPIRAERREMFITSRNGFNFSIGFNVHMDGISYYGLITKNHNKVVIVHE